MVVGKGRTSRWRVRLQGQTCGSICDGVEGGVPARTRGEEYCYRKGTREAFEDADGRGGLIKAPHRYCGLPGYHAASRWSTESHSHALQQTKCHCVLGDCSPTSLVNTRLHPSARPANFKRMRPVEAATTARPYRIARTRLRKAARVVGCTWTAICSCTAIYCKILLPSQIDLPAAQFATTMLRRSPIVGKENYILGSDKCDLIVSLQRHFQEYVHKCSVDIPDSSNRTLHSYVEYITRPNHCLVYILDAEECLKKPSLVHATFATHVPQFIYPSFPQTPQKTLYFPFE